MNCENCNIELYYIIILYFYTIFVNNRPINCHL